MGQFKDFVAEAKPLSYYPQEEKIVMLKASRDAQHALQRFAIYHGFDLSVKWSGGKQDPKAFDFHVTVIASKNQVQLSDCHRKIPTIELFPDHYETFDGRLVKGKIPVLKLHANEPLLALREYYILVEQFDPTFPDFKPHVSLSYSYNGVPKIKDIPLPDFPIAFDTLTVEKFEPN